MHSSELIERFNGLLAEMGQKSSLDAGLRLAKLFMELVTPSAASIDPDRVVDSSVLDVLSLGNSKMDNWFVAHPYLGGHYSAFQLFDSSHEQVESKFYQLNQRTSKHLIAGAVHLTPNWEDNTLLTRNADWRVGIDFFLTHDAKALLVVLSLEGNLRVVELSERLTSTQAGILAKVTGAGDLPTREAVHATLWDAFAIREVNRDFYQGVAAFFDELREKLIQDKRDEEDAKLFTSRLIGRLLFVWFLRRKGLIADGRAYFDPTGRTATNYYDEVLKRLFYGILNTPVKERISAKDLETPYLNGGLFEFHSNDWAGDTIEFPDGFFTRLYEHFDRFNFTTDESSPDYEQVAIDPEMLGRVFESLLATQRTETGESARKAKGTFYTPREVVAYMCKEALRQHLYSKLDNGEWNPGIDKLLDSSYAYVARQHSNFKRDLWGKENVKIVVPKVLAAIDELKILDPACGSGAFPLGMVHLLTRTLERLDARFDPYKTKLRIIKDSIYGVDIEPMAIEIAKLRTWLALVVDEADLKNVDPLPNLDFKFVCANSLISLTPEHEGLEFGVDTDLDEKLADIRTSYFETSSPLKKKKLKEEYYKLTQPSFASDLDLRTRQLNSFDPFKFSGPAQFFDPMQMFGVDSFDIVVGNPPYIGEDGNKAVFDAVKGTRLRDRFYLGKMDFFYFFIHLGIDLLRDDGVLVFITTNYYPTANGAFKLRSDLAERTRILKLVNFNELTVFDSARGQHDMITVLSKSKDNADYWCKQIVMKASADVDQSQLERLLRSDSDLAISAEVHVNDLFDGARKYIRFATQTDVGTALVKMSNAGQGLGSILEINQGVAPNPKEVTASAKKRFPSIAEAAGTPLFVLPRGTSGFAHAKPLFTNSDISRFITKTEASQELLYLGRGSVPTQAELTHLERFKQILTARREFNPAMSKRPLPWYQLHWPRDERIFTGPKIVAPYRSLNNTFAYTRDEWYGLTDVYFLTLATEDIDLLFALLGILNSDLLYTWLYFRGKQKGGMLELFQTPLSEIPIARNPDLEMLIANLAREVHESLSEDLTSSTADVEAEINELVYRLYGLNDGEVAAVRVFVNSRAVTRRLDPGSVAAEGA
ncbi:Eco57I restriction-modification methylase domain-containing protein [Cryobacterium sp. 10I5]|uniref:Eco57I restriction-modification methylase domain-containing protein n=1 Tax=Cryobacterium sp. 10I5 TaxID=3048581 RepID=UPI002B23250A|nr:DNA methyltransferase [Cryobacterium sp. 10I5]MEB0267652.1 Eco57I restriction-modification methylase domain-containing protein [Cryobacterium sp. 10I5]